MYWIIIIIILICRVTTEDLLLKELESALADDIGRYEQGLKAGDEEITSNNVIEDSCKSLSEQPLSVLSNSTSQVCVFSLYFLII